MAFKLNILLRALMCLTNHFDKQPILTILSKTKQITGKWMSWKALHITVCLIYDANTQKYCPLRWKVCAAKQQTLNVLDYDLVYIRKKKKSKVRWHPWWVSNVIDYQERQKDKSFEMKRVIRQQADFWGLVSPLIHRLGLSCNHS